MVLMSHVHLTKTDFKTIKQLHFTQIGFRHFRHKMALTQTVHILKIHIYGNT